jgi:hypothetical protein
LRSRRLRVPLSCGLLRPAVLLPASLCADPGGPALRWALAHELTHLERGDAWSCLLFGLGQAVFFPLPWFWWLRRRVRLCQEYVADAAAAQGGAAEDYAQFLLGLSAAPAVPAAALGVLGHSSDLLRRVTMLLHTPAPLEKRSPRLWSLGVAGGLLGLAVLVAGVGLRAYAAPAAGDEAVKKDDLKREAPKKEDKKDEPRKDQPGDGFPDIEDMLKRLPPGSMPPEQMKQMREQMKKMMEQMRQFQPGNGFPGGGGFGGGQFPGAVNPFGGAGMAGGFNFFGREHEGRLGVRTSSPSETLSEQLDLPKNQGVVIEQVVPDSASAKAGLKPHDILLELNGKAVPHNPAELARLVQDIKANTPVDAVVLRRGKKETVKGLSLPEAAPAGPGGLGGFPGGRFGGAAGGFPGGGVGIGGGFGGLPGGPGAAGGIGGGFPGFAGGGAGGVVTTVFRNNDRFTARHQEGNLIITLTGTVSDGKAKTSQITVQDAGVSNKYESVDKVPEQYRDKVKSLVDQMEKGPKITVREGGN